MLYPQHTVRERYSLLRRRSNQMNIPYTGVCLLTVLDSTLAISLSLCITYSYYVPNVRVYFYAHTSRPLGSSLVGYGIAGEKCTTNECEAMKENAMV